MARLLYRSGRWWEGVTCYLSPSMTLSSEVEGVSAQDDETVVRRARGSKGLVAVGGQQWQG